MVLDACVLIGCHGRTLISDAPLKYNKRVRVYKINAVGAGIATFGNNAIRQKQIACFKRPDEYTVHSFKDIAKQLKKLDEAYHTLKKIKIGSPTQALPSGATNGPLTRREKEYLAHIHTGRGYHTNRAPFVLRKNWNYYDKIYTTDLSHPIDDIYIKYDPAGFVDRESEQFFADNDRLYTDIPKLLRKGGCPAATATRLTEKLLKAGIESVAALRRCRPDRLHSVLTLRSEIKHVRSALRAEVPRQVTTTELLKYILEKIGGEHSASWIERTVGIFDLSCSGSADNVSARTIRAVHNGVFHGGRISRPRSRSRRQSRPRCQSRPRRRSRSLSSP
jgi:hypothetical protein